MTVTFKNDASFLNDTVALWKTYAARIAKVSGLIYSMLNQHLLPIVMEKTAGLGGNSLGLDAANGPLILTLVSATWDHAADDEAVTATIKSLIAQIEHAAKDRGVYNAFKSMNYAYVDQAVIEGFGRENKRFLQAVSRKYDPQGVFQKQVPGGFKLFAKSKSKTL